MQQKRGCVLLSVACVLLVFCAVRAVRKPAASDGARRIEVCEARAQANEIGTDTPFWKAAESLETSHVQAAQELERTRLETAGAAQRMRQQEAAHELQRRQQQAPLPLS
jgi:hypothetical protein